MGCDVPDVMQRLHDATNRHDLEAMLRCFAEDYRSEQPVHPDRAFVGAAQVRKNWSALLGSMPDFQAKVVRATRAGDEAWVEWHWRGTRHDGSAFEARGVAIFGIVEDRIAWARLYMSDVEHEGAGIDATVRQMAGPT